MILVVYILLTMVCCAFGGLSIACALDYLNKKRYFHFGLSVMYVASSLMIMAKLVFTF